jgi:hypothetical protein
MGKARSALRAKRGAVPAVQSHDSSRLLIWIFQLLLVSISKSLTSVSGFAGRILAFQLWGCRSTFRVFVWLRRVIERCTAYLWAPAFTNVGSRGHSLQRWVQGYGLPALRRLHVVLGE